jgi:hypothetical protein
MALFDKPLDQITEDDLDSLIENQVREGYQIEYKRAVAFRDKQDKLDFLAGVTSFANTVGGDLLIGITADNGVPVAADGWAGIDVDREKQRIENLLRDQAEPRVAFSVREIRLRNGNTALLIRVPWSWAQPHMVRMDQVNRFYYRHSAGKDIMNVSQLRAAFALTTRLEDQIAAFRRERIAGIMSGKAGYLTPPPGASVVVHLVPFESFRSGFSLDLEPAMRLAEQNIRPLAAGSDGHFYCLDGIYCLDNIGQCKAYSLIFRGGAIETADRTTMLERQGRRLIPCSKLTQDVLRHVRSVIAFYQELRVPPPVAAMVTLLGVGDHEFATELSYPGRAQPVGRDDLLLPDVLVQDFSTSPADICRPIFDALYNAAGLPKWPGYDAAKRRF